MPDDDRFQSLLVAQHMKTRERMEEQSITTDDHDALLTCAGSLWMGSANVNVLCGDVTNGNFCHASGS